MYAATPSFGSQHGGNTLGTGSNGHSSSLQQPGGIARGGPIGQWSHGRPGEASSRGGKGVQHGGGHYGSGGLFPASIPPQIDSTAAHTTESFIALHRLDERCGGYRVLCSSSHQYFLCTMVFRTLFYIPTFSVPCGQNHYRHLLFPNTKKNLRSHSPLIINVSSTFFDSKGAQENYETSRPTVRLQ